MMARLHAGWRKYCAYRFGMNASRLQLEAPNDDAGTAARSRSRTRLAGHKKCLGLSLPTPIQ